MVQIVYIELVYVSHRGPLGLTHWGLVTSYGDIAWRHQAITWTNVDLSSVRSSYIHLMAISQEIQQSSMTKINMKITHLKCH